MSINVKNTIDRVGSSDKVITGGIDWTKDGINAVRSGLLEASVGGHFAELGFTMVIAL